MFKGFQQKLPEYEVITPQTKNTFTVRTMNVSDEENLKGSFVVSVKMIDHLNRCIFSSLSSMPPNIKTYEDFLEKTSTIDRESLLYGLYHITYGDIRNYDIVCGSCEKSYSVNISSSDIFSICIYPGEDDILKKSIPINLPIHKNVKVYIKQPSLQEEYSVLKTYSPALGKQASLVNNALLIEKFEDYDESGVLSMIYDSKEDIIDAYSSLTPLDKREINKCYEDNFGKYSTQLKYKTICSHCGYAEDITIDLVSQFFRMVHSV